MDRQTQATLLDEIKTLEAEKAFFVSKEVHASPVERYTSAERFAAERKALFRSMPVIAAHASELNGPGSYLTLHIAGSPVLLTRDKTGKVNAFLNVCRHRGTRLVGDASGCKKVFSCPYHGWTWDNEGTLRGVPHEKQGFPDLDRSQFGLKRLPVSERAGLIWVVADPAADADFDAHLAPLEDDLTWLEMADLGVVATSRLTINANWKLIVEGGIEAYHFRVTHRHTIGPHFMDNLSSFQMLGPHMRSILPRTSVSELATDATTPWSIRDHANLLYSLMPMDQFLVLQDHISWIHAEPVSESQTELRISTLAPRSQITPEKEEHWARNHKITGVTLAEDFEVNEAAQVGMLSGANESLTFGRYESALHVFNSLVEERVAAHA